MRQKASAHPSPYTNTFWVNVILGCPNPTHFALVITPEYLKMTILLSSINLVLCLKEPKVTTNRITQLPAFEPSAPTIDNNYDVLQSAYHIVVPISHESQ